MIRVSEELVLDESELRFTFARSGGPGGQNVNKVSSRATLWFDVRGSGSLSPLQMEKILSRLPGRINRDGVLRVVSQKHRSQSANREEAIERLVSLLGWALSEDPPRRPTRVPGRARVGRLEDKRKRSRLKKERSRDWGEER